MIGLSRRRRFINQAKARKIREKSKVQEPHKKRKLVHSSGSSTIKFGTILSYSGKANPPSQKLMESTMKAVKVEMVRRAEDKEAK